MKISPTSRLTVVFLLIGLIIGGTQTPSEAQKSNDQELFLVAQKAFEDGFYDVAVRYIDQLLEEHPQSERAVQARLLLGQCYFFKGQFLKAFDIFQDLLAYNELKDATLFWLGETYLKGSDYPQAEKYYKQVLDQFPKSDYAPQALYSLGWVHFEEGRYEQAKTTFEKLIADFPAHTLTEDAAFKAGEAEYYLKNYNETIDYFKDFVERFPQSTRRAESYFYIAESHYYLGNFSEASEYYENVAKASYDNKLILMAKVSHGWSELKRKNFEKSQSVFQDALEFSTQKGILSDDVYLGLATLYSEKDQPRDALKAYSDLIKNFPQSHRIADAYLGKANMHYALEEYQQAILAYQEVIDRYKRAREHQDTVEKAYFGMAWSYLKDGNIDRSIQTFEAIKDHSENHIVKVSALTQIGDAYLDVGKFEKALDIYDRILEEYPDSAYTDYVQYRQGVALLKMNRFNAATMSLRSFQAKFPDSKYHSEAQYYLAVAYLKMEDYKAAREQIANFVDQYSADNEFMDEALYIYGFTQYQLGEYAKAEKTFRKVIKNYPGQPQIVQKSEYQIALCRYEQGETQDAVKSMNILINKYPNSEIAEESLIWLGNHYLRNEDIEKAMAHYRRFLEKFPQSTKTGFVYFQIGQAHLSESRYDEAVQALNKIEKKHGSELFAKAKLTIADIFSRELAPEAAIETYENIVLNSPEFSRDAYIKIAEVQKDLDRYDDAIRAYRNALKSNAALSSVPDAEIQFQMADTYEYLNDTETAIKEYFKIPYLYPKSTHWGIKAYLRIARIYEDEENWEGAVKIYSKISEYQTDENKFVQERLEWIRENTDQDINP